MPLHWHSSSSLSILEHSQNSGGAIQEHVEVLYRSSPALCLLGGVFLAGICMWRKARRCHREVMSKTPSASFGTCCHSAYDSCEVLCQMEGNIVLMQKHLRELYLCHPKAGRTQRAKNKRKTFLHGSQWTRKEKKQCNDVLDQQKIHNKKIKPIDHHQSISTSPGMPRDRSTGRNQGLYQASHQFHTDVLILVEDGAAGVASVSRAQKLPHVRSEPAPAGSKRDLLLARAETGRDPVGTLGDKI
ncbi:hypothetical protein LUU34_01402100 [Aix galericulata]|nr:hypothetical protein LUU34_01402100 [Aix galericulata]